MWKEKTTTISCNINQCIVQLGLKCGVQEMLKEVIVYWIFYDNNLLQSFPAKYTIITHTHKYIEIVFSFVFSTLYMWIVVDGFICIWKREKSFKHLPILNCDKCGSDKIICVGKTKVNTSKFCSKIQFGQCRINH